MLLPEEDIRKISLEKRKAIHSSYEPQVEKVGNVQKVEVKKAEDVINDEEKADGNVKTNSNFFKKNVKEETKSNKKK